MRPATSSHVLTKRLVESHMSSSYSSPKFDVKIWSSIPPVRSSWGENLWCELGEFKTLLSHLYNTHGCGRGQVLHLNTFYPRVGPSGPHFTWVVQNNPERAWLCEGDMLFCPLPSTQAYSRRVEIGPGGHLFLSYQWCMAVAQLVEKMPIVEFRCKSSIGESECFAYEAVFANGQKFPIPMEEVLKLCPPLNQPTDYTASELELVA
jgi:hypothetical protein